MNADPAPLPLQPPAVPGRSVRLQWLLLAQPAAVVVPLVLFAALLLHLVADRAAEQARQDLRTSARTLALAVERELGNAVRRMEQLAESPTLSTGDPHLEAFRTYARRLVGPAFDLRSVAVLDRAGKQLADTGRLDDEQPTRPLRPHHLAVFATGRPVVSEVHESALDGKASISVNVPVRQDGETRWLLTARLEPQGLARLLAEHASNNGQITAVIDANRRFVARSEDTEQWFGRPMDPRALALVDAARAGTARYPSAAGDDLLWAWHTLPSGWTVFIGMPAARFEAPVARQLARLGAVGAAVLGLGLLAAATIGRRVTRSVSMMAEQATPLLEGRATRYVPSRIRELDALYQALVAASQRLASANQARIEALQAERVARAQAETASRAKDEFLSMLSHELRNPLAPIVNAHAMIGRTQPLDTRGQAALAMATRQAGQLTRLVDDLLDATRIVQGKLSLRITRVDVARLVDEAIEAMLPQVEARGLTLRVQPSSDAGWIDADPARLMQVLENLLGNAIKFTPPGGRITVSVADQGESVGIWVSDTGVGIAPSDLERVFEPFIQTHATIDRQQGGLGIGLAWVRSIVTLHGGTVSAHSLGKDRGATFHVTLPRRAARDAA